MKLKYKFILASNSPRRQELLKMMDIPFEVSCKQGIDESFPDSLEPECVPEYLAKKKAEAYLNDMKDNEILITADTIVIFGNKILGKPKNSNEAFEMLSELNGREHKVVTGVSVTSKAKQCSFSETTIVRMRKVKDIQLKYYIDKYKPFDKAGAYGIQEYLGIIAIDHIEGSYQNVMGLPTQHLADVVENFWESE